MAVQIINAAAEIGRNPVSRHQTQPECGDEQAGAGRDCRTRHARPNFHTRTGTGKYSFSLFSWLTTSRIDMATLPGWFIHIYIHRRGGGIASSSLVFCLHWYSYVGYFVCDSASEFGVMGSTSFLGFSYRTLLLFFSFFFLFFSEPVIFRNLYHIFVASVGLFWVFFTLSLFFCTLFWVSLWPRKFVSLPWRVRKRRILDRGQNGF